MKTSKWICIVGIMALVIVYDEIMVERNKKIANAAIRRNEVMREYLTKHFAGIATNQDIEKFIQDAAFIEIAEKNGF